MLQTASSGHGRRFLAPPPWLVPFFSFLFPKWRLLGAHSPLPVPEPGSRTMKAAHWVSSFMGFAEANGAHPISIAADSTYFGEFRSHCRGCRHSSLSPRPCQNHGPWVDGFPHPVRSPGEIAVARYAKELSAKKCVSPLQRPADALARSGRSQGSRDSKSPPRLWLAVP